MCVVWQRGPLSTTGCILFYVRFYLQCVFLCTVYYHVFPAFCTVCIYCCIFLIIVFYYCVHPYLPIGMTLTSSIDTPTSNPSRCTSAQCPTLQSSAGKEHPRASLCSRVSMWQLLPKRKKKWKISQTPSGASNNECSFLTNNPCVAWGVLNVHFSLTTSDAIPFNRHILGSLTYPVSII